jgi:uncharacterized protein YndB with AHSA1/START domain
MSSHADTSPGASNNRPDGIENLPESRTIRSSRLFEASRERLWALFENPVDLGVWWGPTGFLNDIEEFDFRAGGMWRFVMRGPDGSRYPMNKRFIRLEAPQLIVMDHLDPVHGFRMFIVLHDAPNGTLLEWIMVFDHAEEAAKVRPFVEPANEQNFDRLAAHLKTR